MFIFDVHQTFFLSFRESVGPCDLLINCAGVAVPGPTTEISAADFSRVMSVNVLGPFLCSREAFKQMQVRLLSFNMHTLADHIRANK